MDPDALLAGLADGLRRRAAERGLAEERLADFVFREGPADASRPALAADASRPALAADSSRPALAADSSRPALVEQAGWRYFVSRTLAAAGEFGTIDLLERLSNGDETFATLQTDRPASLEGGLATVDRIGGLAASGLVIRDLETGRVRLTDLGSAVVAFVRAWELRAAEPAPRARQELR